MIKIKTKTQKNALLKLVWAKFGFGDEILGWVWLESGQESERGQMSKKVTLQLVQMA